MRKKDFPLVRDVQRTIAEAYGTLNSIERPLPSAHGGWAVYGRIRHAVGELGRALDMIEGLPGHETWRNSG